VSEETTNSALLSFDFLTVFPHKTWISDWSTDAVEADRFRYKLMSSRDVSEGVIQFLVVLQKHDGTKEVLKHLRVSLNAFDRVAAVFIEGLADQYGLDFQEQDFSSCTTPERFEEVALGYRWTSGEP